jgi:NDP-hexose 2,3-enoyl reductase
LPDHLVAEEVEVPLPHGGGIAGVACLDVLHDLAHLVDVPCPRTDRFELAPAQLLPQRRLGVSERDFGFVVEQSIYSLMERTVELELLPACRAYGIGVVAYSPLNSGLLAGILRKTDAASRSSSGRAATGLAEQRARIEHFEAFCDALGEHPASVAQAWLLHQPGVTAPIVGARTVAHLDAALRALEIALGDAELQQLDEIFPGPGGPAPEAYAW